MTPTDSNSGPAWTKRLGFLFLFVVLVLLTLFSMILAFASLTDETSHHPNVLLALFLLGLSIASGVGAAKAFRLGLGREQR